MNYILSSDLEFLELAKRKFSEKPRLDTYRDDKYNLIALRTGPDRDSILIFEYGRKLPLFMSVLEKGQKLIVKGDDNEN